MKLEHSIRKTKDFKGRIMSVTASFGNVEADAKNEKDAATKLETRVSAYCAEDATPFVMLDPDGHAWVAYRSNGGDWGYTHYRPMAGYKAAMQSGGTFLANPTRENTVKAMIAHFEQLHGEIKAA